MLSTALPQMVGDIRKYVQHISLSPDSIQNDEVSARPAEGSAWWEVCAWWDHVQPDPEDTPHRLWPRS